MIHLVWTVAVSALVFAAAALLLLGWLRACGAPLPPAVGGSPPDPAGVFVDRREAGKIFALALLFRLAVALVGAVILAGRGVSGLEGNLNAWMRWDGLHYVNLVELGYSGYVEEGQHLFLVFFPLYVWLVRLLNLFIQNTLLSGMLVSSLAYAGGCVSLYRLAALEYGRTAARRAVLFLSLFPYAFFFGGMMTEGLFLLTTAAALYAIRRHRWLAAGIWGALAAATRMQGILMAGVAVVELLEHARPFARSRAKGETRGLWKGISAVCLPFLGTIAYLGLNYAVDGDPFSFVRQQVHWSQGFSWISETLWYVLQNALYYFRTDVQAQIWIPTLILFPLFFAVLLAARKRHRSMYLFYGFGYLILNYSLSWLLSAGRYLSCALPFFLFAAVLTEKRPMAARAIMTLMGALFLLNLTVFLTGGQIM